MTRSSLGIGLTTHSSQLGVKFEELHSACLHLEQLALVFRLHESGDAILWFPTPLGKTVANDYLEETVMGMKPLIISVIADKPPG